MKTIRAAIVGTTFIAQAHWDALRRIPGVEIAAVCGKNLQETRAFAQRNQIPAWYTDTAAMLRESKPDVLHNCAATCAHDEVNRCAIETGVHLYAEKPLSDSAQTAKEIWQGAQRAGILHGLNHQYRMNAAVQEMRARVLSGEAGRVFFAYGQYHQQSGLEPTDFLPRMAEAGVTWALSDIGTHWVDTACCVMGTRVRRVFASISTIHPQRTGIDGRPHDVHTDDLCSLLLEFANGAQGAFTVSKVSAGQMNHLLLSVDAQQCSLHWAQESPNLLRIGRRGQADGSLQMHRPLLHDSAADLVTLPGGHPLGWNDALLASVREFYAAVRGEIAQSALRCATLEDGYALAAFVDAAVASSREERWVAIDL